MSKSAPDRPQPEASNNPAQGGPPQLDNPLWDYALARYAHPQTQTICLQWQNQFGADVNLLLACGWLALRQRRFNPASDFSAIDSWRAEIVLPLRTARNALNKQDCRQHALRQRILQLELAAERYEISLIYALLSGTGKEDLSAPQEAVETVALCRRNLLDYFSRLNDAQEVNQAQLNLVAANLVMEM
ncbi:TIGR02444 family protein [Hahella sp. HN01]|uniref:TIGR02444 family protein n=1 Tax=Hahella sp. HN01 TaxID=2847262 RepID=UPI001C1EC5D2|nr:TIGR02444 family protein [Hahella sp. HN01]MBU6950437.1 TIGR02444 family protein [Hahella sp. HN01]